MVNQVIVETSLITFGTFGRGFDLLDYMSEAMKREIEKIEKEEKPDNKEDNF